MSTKTINYVIPENYPDPAILDAFLHADEMLVRLDERMRISPLGPPCVRRLLYRNACSAMHNQHCIVYLEDLVLLDGHSFSGQMYPDLSSALGILKHWQSALACDAAALLAAPMPGEQDRLLPGLPHGQVARDLPDMFYDPAWDEAARLAQWQHVRAATRSMPPLLAAATVWDAWQLLRPEQQGVWRANLLAALLLRARGKTQHILMPLDYGERQCRKRWRAVESVNQRMLNFFEIACAAVKHCRGEFEGLCAAKERMGLRLKDVQKNSRLPDLINLMIERPLVSIPLAARALGISQQAVRLLLPKLGSTPRELSERKRYRAWTVP